ncbi:hypothetical protein Q7P37_009743 [Cladosporium fusiforme]
MATTADHGSFQTLKNRLSSSELGPDDAEELIIEFMERALVKESDVNEHFVELAAILEAHNFGKEHRFRCGSQETPDSFWTTVDKARATKRRYKEDIKSVWPNEVFDHYQWDKLGVNSLLLLKRIVDDCDKHVPDKAETWPMGAFILNWAMLERDKRFAQKSPYLNSNIRIGSHSGPSVLQDPKSPLERQDIQRACLWMKDKDFWTAAPKEWRWGDEETVRYMQREHLGFDKHGLLVKVERGSLDNRLLKRFLFRDSPTDVARTGVETAMAHVENAGPPSAPPAHTGPTGYTSHDENTNASSELMDHESPTHFGMGYDADPGFPMGSTALDGAGYDGRSQHSCQSSPGVAPTFFGDADCAAGSSASCQSSPAVNVSFFGDAGCDGSSSPPSSPSSPCRLPTPDSGLSNGYRVACSDTIRSKIDEVLVDVRQQSYDPYRKARIVGLLEEAKTACA